MVPGIKRLVNTRVVGLLALAGLVAAGIGTSPAGAADTTSSVSRSHRTSTWSGGPFVVPNVTAQAGDQPDCTTPQSCDDHTLHVRTPDGYGRRHQLVVKVAWGNAAADFDVYVLTSAGHVVATAASSADPEEVVLPGRAAKYTVRIVPFAPLGETYKATASLVDKPSRPAPAPVKAPGFRTYHAPKRLPDHNDAGEPSIGVKRSDNATFYQAYLSTYRVTFDTTRSPARAIWRDRSAHAQNGCVVGGVASLDPILYTDAKIGRTFESQLSGNDSLTCYTDDEGKTWLPSEGGGVPSGVDHQTLGGGAFSDGTVGGVLSKRAVYYCSQDIATALCAVSRDGGVTFGPGVPVYNLLDCGGLHGHLKVGPDGTAYLPNKGCGATQGMVVSKDNGTSWTVRHVKGSTPGDSDPSIGVGARGTVYFGYVGADGRPGIAVSHDDGKTWRHHQQVGAPYGIKNAVFPAVVAGDDNRAAFAYLGTPTGGNYQDSKHFHGVWHLYVSYTFDGGRHWVTSDATPRDPVQRGSICTGGTTCGSDRNLLDFMDVTIDGRGRVLVGYADGCIHRCVTSAKPRYNTRSAWATISRQQTGKTLFARLDKKAS